ncbi:MAG TPA: hypothetical protein VMH84_12405 [Xanthobacteraceae bacterium]|nr:hypothetical protein [Xanthobacteraceae bacterium]
MPIREADPWRLQYFEGVPCPANVEIPTEDSDAWTWNPRHRWVYDKIAIALSQGLEAAPHGVAPPRFPVFSKPTINLRGMGVGSRVLHDEAEYRRHCAPGHMWMTLLDGKHVSSDVAVEHGEPRWWRHAVGVPAGEGTFDHWTVHAAAYADIEKQCGEWVRKNLADYTGMLNLETIGGVIIEAHLRFADQWPDLYGVGWVEALVRFYQLRKWEFVDRARRDGYSVVLFGPKNGRYRHPPRALIEDVSLMDDISSVQITFHEQRAPEAHAMPPGGFRLAIVNCWNLESGKAAREKLREFFLPR